MTAQQTMTALFDIADADANKYKAAAEALPRENVTEKKALIISRNMAGNCANFARIEYNGKAIETRRRFTFENHNYFDAIKPTLNALEADGKTDDAGSLIVFTHAVTMVRHCFYDPRTEQIKNAAASDAQSVFEARIIAGVCGEILKKWIKWWNENGCADAGGCDGCKL